MNERLKLFLFVLCCLIFFYIVYKINVGQINHNQPQTPKIEINDDIWKLVHRPIFSSHTKVFFNLNDDSQKLTINNVIGCSQGVGISMYPSVSSGNILCYKKFKAEEVYEGDIVMYKPKTNNLYKEEDIDYVFHRVSAIYPLENNYYKYIVRGDYPSSQEEEISSKDIEGIVVAILLK